MLILSLTLLTWGRKFAVLSYHKIRVGNYNFVYYLCYRYDLCRQAFIVHNFLCIFCLLLWCYWCYCIVNQSCVSYPWLDWLQGENFLNCRTTEWGSPTSNLCIICVFAISFWPILIYESRMYWLWPVFHCCIDLSREPPKIFCQSPINAGFSLEICNNTMLHYIARSIGLVNNIPTMQFFFGISRNTQSKSYMLSLTECVWDFQNIALWDTHYMYNVSLWISRSQEDNSIVYVYIFTFTAICSNRWIQRTQVKRASFLSSLSVIWLVARQKRMWHHYSINMELVL